MSGSGLEIERKFLLAAAPAERSLRSHGAKPAAIEQVYLIRDEGDPRRIRRIDADGSIRFVLTKKRSLGGIIRREVEHPIDAATYDRLLAEADPTRRPIHKTRWTWAEAGRTWELDVFEVPPGLTVLEVELPDPDAVAQPPAWLHVVRDVSTDAAYTNWRLARVVPDDEAPA